jgi:riboflavin synthase
MFTGIVESTAEVLNRVQDQSNIHFQLTCPFIQELKVDQSISHNGVCLTVTKLENQTYWVTAIEETISKTNLSTWAPKTKVNLERCMPAQGRFDGHIVQGHVDQTAICTLSEEANGSWKFGFQYEPNWGHITVSKGSVCVNGVGLTVVDSKSGYFSVAIIPYTYEHTTFGALGVGDLVNLEFDILGKYIQKIMQGRMDINHPLPR